MWSLEDYESDAEVQAVVKDVMESPAEYVVKP